MQLLNRRIAHRPPRRAVILAGSLVAAVMLAVACSSDPVAGVKADPDSDTVVVVRFSDSADLDGLDDLSWQVRGEEVQKRLEAVAESSQKDVREQLKADGVEATTYWINNSLAVPGGRATADQLAKVDGVESVVVEPVHPHSGPDSISEVAAPPNGVPTANVSEVEAQASWSAGRDGTGATVGMIDTGIDPSHPALVGAVRQEHGWFDAVGGCKDSPCDKEGHGTHVAGTLAGGQRTGTPEAVPLIGVAPGVELVVARACGEGGCSETDLLEAAQWMLAPGGDHASRPVVLLNSWDLDASDSTLERVPGVWRAAGQLPVFSAGNSGPGCGTLGSPAGEKAVVAVGAQDRNGSPTDATSRSSGTDGKLVPQLWAPGQGVVSALPGGKYGQGDGSSMAASHVAGALGIALGDGRDIGEAEEAVLAAAVALDPEPSCGSDGSSATTVPARPAAAPMALRVPV